MGNFKRYSVPLLTLSICAVLLFGYWFLYQKKQNQRGLSEQFIQDKESLSRLLQNSSEIRRIWSEGEDSREWSLIKKECLNYYKITSPFDESLLRCHPMILMCNSLFNKKLNYNFVNSGIENNQTQIKYRYVTKSNFAHVGLSQSGYLFTIEDKLSHEHLNILLADQCQEVYLQKRLYAYGEEITGKPQEDFEDYRFDNFNQNIYIDRHLVLNSDINDWIEFGNKTSTVGLNKTYAEDLLKPATGLNITQMETFCSYKGKQLMLAHIFDAATFLPMDLNEVMPKKNNRSPYYWIKKKSEFSENCSLLYAEECLAKVAYKTNSSSPSWAGVFDSLGGVLEAFRNPIDPESNLKASSFYFNFKSSWHKLGFRAGWDGNGFELRHFNFKGINSEQAVDKFQVGFRCMRESR